MDLTALLANVGVALEQSPTWRDRIGRLAWLYSANGRQRRWWWRARRRLGFVFAPPVGALSLTVRDNGGADAFILSEVFQHRYYDVGLRRAPRTILDLGANIGFVSIFLARSYPGAQVACVEPMPDNLSVLRENLAANRIPAVVIPGAVAVEDGTILMAQAESDWGHKVADIASGPAFTGPTVQVEALSVPTLLERLGWSAVDLLKVDIEGYERVLFAGDVSWLSRVGALLLECHEGFGERELGDLARRHGFDAPRELRGTWILERPADGSPAEAARTAGRLA